MQPQQILVVHVNSLCLLIETSCRKWCGCWQCHIHGVGGSTGTSCGSSTSECIVHWNCVCTVCKVAREAQKSRARSE